MKSSKPIKPKLCKACPKKFIPAKPMQSVCDWKCAAVHAENLRIKREKAEALKSKRETKQKLVALKSINDLIKEAQTAFNAFIRERDKDQLCICCGKPYGTNALGGDFDAGHYRTRGAAGHLRFNEDNCFGQRKYCNTYNAGDFRAGVIKRIGLERTLAIENNNETHKWTREELIEIKQTYKAKLKVLKQEQERLAA
jgi:hypothetical protein